MRQGLPGATHKMFANSVSFSFLVFYASLRPKIELIQRFY